jgi:hypothetical protein
MADPSLITFLFTCPTVTGSGHTVLSNFGSKVAGYGTELIDGNPSFNSPYFSTPISGSTNIPTNLTTGDYSSSATSFDNINGLVFCSYTSSTTFDPFTVAYQLTNGNGGQVAEQTLNTITIFQFLGLNKG